MFKEGIDNFINDHKVISHILTHYAGQVVGFNLGYYLSNPRNNKLFRELNGIALGATIGIIGNIGLFYYKNSNYFKPTKKNSLSQEDDSENLENSAELIGEIILHQ